MAEKFVLQNGKKVSVIDPKSFKKKEIITIPQAFYKNSIFLPVLQEQHEIDFNTKKSIEIDNINKFNIFHPILNQMHANIIDATLYNAIQYKIDTFNDNIVSVNITVALDEVIKMLHIGNNYSWFYKKILEIQQVNCYMNFRVYDAKHRGKLHSIQTPIINFISIKDDIVQNKYISSIGRYAPYAIIGFSPLFIYLMRNSYTISFPSAFILKILSLKYPINQAIARYCLASGDVNENLENLLVKLGVDADEISLGNYFSIIEEEKNKLSKYFGIQINQNNSELIIQANKNNAVRIYAPKSPFFNVLKI